MKKRAPGGGRKPLGQYGGKLSNFSTRITPQLRAQIDAAAAESGRSVSQEVEHRLRLSFLSESDRARLIDAEKTVNELGRS